MPWRKRTHRIEIAQVCDSLRTGKQVSIMWKGGVRVIVLDDEERMLLVKQHHEDRDIWMVPGGGILDDEGADEAAVREVKEETGVDISVDGLLWHVEEVSERGQRFVNFFMAHVAGPQMEPSLGSDPELAEDAQVLREVRFMSRDEMAKLEVFYPEYLKDEFWELREEGKLKYNAFRLRERRK